MQAHAASKMSPETLHAVQERSTEMTQFIRPSQRVDGVNRAHGCRPTTPCGVGRFENVTESSLCNRIATAVENGPLVGQGAEQAVEEEKSDAEVLVHESLVV